MPPMFDLEYTEEQLALAQTARDFAKKEIIPNASEWDQQGHFPDDKYKLAWETGLMNVVVSKGCWTRFRRVAREAAALVIRGRLERSEGVINIVAEHLAPLPVPGKPKSRDFR